MAIKPLKCRFVSMQVEVTFVLAAPEAFSVVRGQRRRWVREMIYQHRGRGNRDVRLKQLPPWLFRLLEL